MSAAVMEREGGDDRKPEILIERLHEMLSQPDIPEPVYDSSELRPAVGEFAVVPLGRERLPHYPRVLGRVATRRVHMRQSAPPPNIYKG